MELLLGQKGPISAPPILTHPYQTAAETIASWAGVTAVTHWHLENKGQVDGVDYYVHDREMGHIHLNGDVHLATDSILRDEFVGSGNAEPFPFGGSYAVWTLYQMRAASDVDHAVMLFRRNYERLLKLTMSE
jgi:hypothetical protein